MNDILGCLMNNKHNMYMEIAKVIALESKAKRKQVGAVIVKNHNIISYGYNGMPNGFDNCCENTHTGKTLVEVLHAETNAIAKATLQQTSIEGATIYITLSPCIECAKLILQCKIKYVYFNTLYRKDDGIYLLRKGGVIVKQIGE